MVKNICNDSAKKSSTHILKLMRKYTWLPLITFLLALSPLTETAKVYAASIYDNAIITTSSLILSQADGLGSEDITYTTLDFMKEHCTTNIYNSFISTLTDEDGSWAISQRYYDVNDPNYSADYSDVYIYWTTSPSAAASFTTFSLNVPFEGFATLALDFNGNPTCGGALVSSTSYISMNYPGNCSTPYLCLPYFSSYLSTYPIVYPVDYDGEYTVGQDDVDGDGLILAQEIIQGTSDYVIDSDSDGINDFTESIWNPDRDDLFCGTECAYPDPTTKDLYVEIDWTNDGVETYKPTSTQLSLVKDKFDEIGVNFHADIGQYGGGNELILPSYEASTNVNEDFYTYKWGYLTSDPANFDINRYRIWHYMITGYQIENETWSGLAEVGGDDTFISFGRLEDNPTGYNYSNFDDAIAGTIVHELGHNLCLSNNSAYIEQDSSCVFSSIDTSASLNYKSAMNYEYQFTNQFSYSSGTNGVGDHNDISGIMAGFGDFTWYDDDSSVGGPS